MPFEIVRNDITKMHVDAIVNPTNESMFGVAGTDGAIHKIAGSLLREETFKLGYLNEGDVKVTKSYNMPSRYIIHTVGPIWSGGNNHEDDILRNCYINSLNLALELNLESIAFPLISSGTYGYPKDKALNTAISVIGEFLLAHEMTIYLVVYDKKSYMLSEKLFSSIEEYIDDNYVEENDFKKTYLSEELLDSTMHYEEDVFSNISESTQAPKTKQRRLEDVVKNIDDTFSEMLLRLIDESGMKDPEVYKKANVTKQTFSKIRNNIAYNPTKPTVLAFAIALELSLDDTTDLLKRAGFALSKSHRFDIIISYFIEIENYNIFEINEALFAYDENLLGF